MPHNNPAQYASCTPTMGLLQHDKDVGEGGNTVFIDASALGELSSQFTPQDLETLVGFNIQAADFEASLQEATEAHVVDASGVLISDGVAVGNIVEVAGGDGGVVGESQQIDTQSHHQTTHHQPMEVDALTEHAQVIGDMEMLQQGSELITMTGEDLSAGGEAGTAALLAAVSSEGDTTSHQIVTDTPQVIKSNLAQFVVLQQNQNSISLGSVGNRIITSGGQVVSTVAGLSNSINSKPVVVNTSQLGGTLRQQMVVTQPTQQTQQVRTVQFRQAPQTLSHNIGTVTKVIITSQAGGGIGTMGGQQVRLVTSQSGGGQVTSSPTKLTLQQAQQMGLISPSKPINPSPNKIVVQRVSMGGVSPLKSPSKLIPVSMASKSPTKIAPAPPIGQQQIITHQISSGGAVRNILNSPQKIVIKSNVPQPGQGTVSTVRTGQLVTSGGQQVIKIPASQVQQLTGQPQVLSNKMNYVRLVNSGVGGSGGGGGGTTLIRPTPPANKPIAPAASQPIKIKAMPIAPNQQASFMCTNKQRVIIPVSGSVSTASMGGGVPIRPQTNLTLPASALPPGVLSNTQPGSVVMIPAHYMSQLQSSTSNNTTVQLSNQPPPGTIIPQPPKPQPTRTVIDANGIRPRKPCNCTKSQCLKLYCDCFANGEFCNNCNCANCFNNLNHEEDRQKAIKACLDRNPQAFRPKIGKGGNDNERRHNKGCNCKRSGCLKNYCECYEAKIPCSNMCKCVGCKNVDMNPAVERKGLMQLAECAEARVNQQKAVRSKLPSFSHHSPTKMLLPTSTKSGYCRMNQEVVEATCQCLLAQADEAESALVSEAQLEQTVIAEFSRCLMQIIGSYTSRSRGLGDT
ncbi:protein lin-54 homolog isoform X2 [Homarus americanus]|uniref:protein lin-54 homolog isoform X2 n=1 Tax=Homarus americanus TaxID=6706 RepID=UPI001C43CB86|nr:protein lin-54 homolog isoform X2 [Homarus americanus]